MIIRKAQRKDVPALLEIYNEEVKNGVATLDLNPKTLKQQMEWFDAHNVANHPLIVAEEDGRAVGYASLSGYRQKEAYRSSTEISIYVSSKYRKRGIASALMEGILALAKEDPDTHLVVAVITSENTASKKLHEKFGFRHCGQIHEVGYKHGKYVDIDQYEWFAE